LRPAAVEPFVLLLAGLHDQIFIALDSCDGLAQVAIRNARAMPVNVNDSSLLALERAGGQSGWVQLNRQGRGVRVRSRSELVDRSVPAQVSRYCPPPPWLPSLASHLTAKFVFHLRWAPSTPNESSLLTLTRNCSHVSFHLVSPKNGCHIQILIKLRANYDCFHAHVRPLQRRTASRRLRNRSFFPLLILRMRFLICWGSLSMS